jgi:hypothetical protein
MPRLKGGRGAGDQFIKVLLDMPADVPGPVRDQLLALDQALASNRSEIRERFERILSAGKAEEKAS